MHKPDDDTRPDSRPEEHVLSHLDARGQARMVDVSAKLPSVRVARAEALVELTPQVRQALLEGRLPKGEAVAVARLAGIQAAKETSRLIPLCHPLALSAVTVDIEPDGDAALRVTAEVRCTGPTGVEMEALTAAAVASLAIYDMCKGLHRGIRIAAVQLVHKSGGRSGTWEREPGAPDVGRAAAEVGRPTSSRRSGAGGEAGSDETLP